MGERRFQRKRISVEVEGSLAVLEGFALVDISQSGALIESHENLQMGRKFCVNFDIPEDNGSISMNVEVIRSTLIGPHNDEEDANLPTYQVGLKFIDPDIDQLKKLLSFILEKEREEVQE